MEQIPQTAEAISKLKSLQESYDELANKISDVAKQGENQEATNSKILEEIKTVKNTFDNLDIPISAISGLALELERGKQNLVSSLKMRGVEASVTNDTLTVLADKIYNIKNPVVTTVSPDIPNELAEQMFHMFFETSTFIEDYESVKLRFCGEGGTYTGCLMTVLSRGTNTTIALTGADAYYILEEDTFYKRGESDYLIQFLDGVEVQLQTNKHLWNTSNLNSYRTVFYLYLPDSTASCSRENVHASSLDYCYNTYLPIYKFSTNSGSWVWLHVSNPDTFYMQWTGGNASGHTSYLYSNMENSKAALGVLQGMPSIRYVSLENLQTATTLVTSSCQKIYFPKLKSFTGSFLIRQSNIKSLDLSQATLLKGTEVNKSCVIGNCPMLETLYLGDYVEIKQLVGGSTLNSTSLISPKNLHIYGKEIYSTAIPSITTNPNSYPDIVASNVYLHGIKGCRINISGSSSYSDTTMKYIYIECCGERSDHIMLHGGADHYNNNALSDIEISNGTRQRLIFKSIKNLTAENIVNHIFEKLADNRYEDDGVTEAPAIYITLESVNLAKLTDEQKAIALNKNYILN